MAGVLPVDSTPRQISVKDMHITQGLEKKAPSQEESKAIQQAAEEEANEKLENAKENTEKAIFMLHGMENDKAAAAIMKMLSGGPSTVNALSTQMKIEIDDVSVGNLKSEQKQKQILAIEKKYTKLMDLAVERERTLDRDVDKLQKSPDKSKQILGYDIRIAMSQSQVMENIKNIGRYEAFITIGRDETRLLTQEMKDQYQRQVNLLKRKNIKLRKDIGVNEKDVPIEGQGLMGKRKEIGGEAPNLVEGLANTLMAGRTEDEIKVARKNPIGFIRSTVADSLASEEGMKSLIAKLKGASLIDEAGAKKFEKQVELVVDYKKENIKKSGTVLLASSFMMGLLAYLAFKQSQEPTQPH